MVLLAGLGPDVVGIDPVPEMIELGRERLREGGVDVSRVEVGGLDWMRRCGPGRFDAVSALNVLPYLSDPEEAEFYAEARRLTGPGGVVVASHTNELVDLVTFNRYTVEFWRDRVIPSLAYDPREHDFLKKRRINPIEYRRILEDRYGLRVEATAFTHFYPMPPPIMEQSARFRDRVFEFEARMRESPLRYVFASIFVFRGRWA